MCSVWLTAWRQVFLVFQCEADHYIIAEGLGGMGYNPSHLVFFLRLYSVNIADAADNTNNRNEVSRGSLAWGKSQRCEAEREALLPNMVVHLWSFGPALLRMQSLFEILLEQKKKKCITEVKWWHFLEHQTGYSNKMMPEAHVIISEVNKNVWCE